MSNNILSIGLAQISPIWLNKELTREKILSYIEEAGSKGCDLVVFGEALLPGYPFWLGLTHGADFNSKMQKEIHAHYIRSRFRSRPVNWICFVRRQRKVKWQPMWVLSNGQRTVEDTACTAPWSILISRERSNRCTGS